MRRLNVLRADIALDLGTGSGNIAIALAKFVPQSQIISVDISAQALEVAKANARQHEVEDRIQFIQDDIMSESCCYKRSPKHTYDLI